MSVKQKIVTIEIIQGVEGKAIYINDRRVAGPKPWGGGSVICKWNAAIEDIMAAIAKYEGGAE